MMVVESATGIFVLNLDCEVENLANNASPPSQPPKVYPIQYRIPSEIIERLGSSQEKVLRAEVFALGGLLYEVFSGMSMLSHFKSSERGGHTQSCFVRGVFPEDVWELPYTKRILACWCPGFANDLLLENSRNETVISRFASYVKKHPIRFGIQVVGSIISLASIIALPILGAVGFGAAGPVAGSAAAAWQSSLGLVEAGSIFAWCQSAGALDDVPVPAPDLKERFLTAWRRDIGEA